MKYLDIKIVEALKPSEYRNLVKGWNKDRYSEIFLNPKYKHDRKGYRVYIPIEKQFRPDDAQNSPVYKEIEQFLTDNGYHIVDYVKGIVQNIEKKQQIKIGKVLTKLNRQDLLNKFNTDKTREGTKAQYMVVLSRHPYDLAGMSTDRGWTSCMNLHSGINRHYVPLDIKQGSVVAYVTTTDDLDLKNPSGRVLMKPFVDILGSPVVHFGIENRVYGTDVPGFLDIVKSWTNEINSKDTLSDVAVLKFNPNLYRDSDLASQTFIRGKTVTPELKAQIKQVQDDGKLILDIENPPEVLQLAALGDRSYLFSRLMDKEGYVPPESVQRLVVAKDARNLDLILDKGIKPSEAVQLAAVGDDWRSIWKLLEKNVDIPESVIERAIEDHPKVIPDLVKANYKLNKNMLLKGLRSNGDMLDWYLQNGLAVDTEVEAAAVENGYTNIYKLFLKYRDRGQQLPEIIVDKAVNGRYAYKIVSEILAHNQNSTGNDIIPLSEKQLLHALITDSKQGYGDLASDIITEYPESVPEKLWVELFKRTYPKEYLIRKLSRKDLISDKGIRQLLPYNGDLIQYIENPTEEEMYSAIKNKPGVISNIASPSPELQAFAVTLDPNTIGSIENPTVEAFRIAAAHKEKNVEWTEGEEGQLNVYTFLNSLIEALDKNIVDDVEIDRLVKTLIKTEPHRIISLIRFESPQFPVTEELQMMAVDKVSNMVPDMLDYEQMPAAAALVAHAKTHGRIWSILDKVARLNRRTDANITLPDEFFYAYLNGDSDDRDPKWLLNTMANANIPISKGVMARVLELTPSAVITLLAQDFEITPEQVFNAVKQPGVFDNDSRFTFLRGVEKRFGQVPEELLIEMLKNPGNKDGAGVSAYLDIKYWAEQDNSEALTDRVNKAALNADYRNILLMPNPSQELRDLNYELNGYWAPLVVGDMIRASNPKATPKYKIVGMTAGGDYKVELDGQDKGIFPKEKVFKANGIEKPADYEEKQMLFAKKWPAEAAVEAAHRLVKNKQILRSDVQNIKKKYNLDQDQSDRLTRNLRNSKIEIVANYNNIPQEFDV